MKRTIEFKDDAKNQKRFELLYGAILVGGAQAQNGQRGGIEVLRREARLLDSLDTISVLNPDRTVPKFPNDEPARLVTSGAAMVIAQADFELLKKRLEDTPWLPKVARDVVDTVDWLSAAPEQTEA
jgi:hypothetical protein